ncbi:MAG: glycerate kinase type-2 family protein [Thiobacillaceae bacterium]
MDATPIGLLRQAFLTAVEAVQAERVLPAHLPPPSRRMLVVGAGKAAAAMAATVEAAYGPQVRLDGLVVTRHGHALPTRRIRVVEAGHPLPDRQGLEAARQILHLVQTAAPGDQILALISGGGSSLLTLPADGLTLADLTAVSRALLVSGAPVAEINCVRKHLTQTLGGWLAAASRAPVLALSISDVAGDDPAVIASGPFAPDPTTHADALAVLARWGIAPPAPVMDHLQRGARGELPETPKPGAACFAQVQNRVIATGHTALKAAAACLRTRGVTPVILGDTVEGEAREVAHVFAAIAREVRRHGSPWLPPVALLSGGETTVTVRGQGRGGRNAEFALALALALQGLAGVYALAADTDGIDGSADHAGALVSPDSLARAAALGIDARTRLMDNDAYGFFAALGDLLVTGPTRTNVNDFRAILIA